MQVKLVFRFVPRKKSVRLFLRGNVDYLIGMGEYKTVEICHKRRADLAVLSNVKAHQSQVKRFLRVAGIRLDPAAVELRE